MEKLKSIAKSIWAKIPKTKTEFKDLFDKCVSFLERWLHKIWAFLKSAYAWIINFYQEHAKFIHKCLYAIAILIWFAVLLIILINLYELYFIDKIPHSWASEVRIAVFTLAAWFGTPFLVWRTMIASKQANTAQEKAYTELFTQAIEQLGSEKPETTSIKDKNGELILDEAGRPLTEEKYVPNIEVRVGALYALERIMHDSDKDAKTIIDTLTTYVKQNCGDPKYIEEEITEEEVTKLQENASANRYDIQTALTIIGRRPPKYKTNDTMPDLTEVNLQGAKLARFDLSLCNLADTHLDGMDLQRANLKEAILEKANLCGAHLEETDLQRASLKEANLQDAILRGAFLTEANLEGAVLQGANLQEAVLKGTNLQWVNSQEANLQEADLQGAILQWADLHRADMRGAKLRGASLQCADLYGAKLKGVKLQGATLWKVNLQEVHITAAHKTAASVIWVDFTKAKYDLDRLQEQLPDMHGHKKLTKLPKDANGEDMKPPKHWSEADMDTYEGHEQYEREWEAFKKEKGVG